MRTLAIDIETYSSVSLQKCGVYAYAQSPDFEILLFGYAWDDGPVEVIDLARGESLPEELQNALYDPEILKTAFNASFERTCLSAFMGCVTPPEQWSCTAVMARELGLPGSLEAVGEVIGLPEDKQKSNSMLAASAVMASFTESNRLLTCSGVNGHLPSSESSIKPSQRPCSMCFLESSSLAWRICCCKSDAVAPI